MIAPTPLQCDSPKVVTRKIVPKVDMPLGYGRERADEGTVKLIWTGRSSR